MEYVPENWNIVNARWIPDSVIQRKKNLQSDRKVHPEFP